MADQDGTGGFEGWAVLELMGHRRLAGWVSEALVGGAPFVRIDVPGDDGQTVATQLYAPGAIYCLTPATEEMARKVAALGRPEPVTPWELRAHEAPAIGVGARRDDGDPDEEAPF